MKKLRALILYIALLLPVICYPLTQEDLDELAGYTQLGSVYASGNIEGSTYNHLIELNNGMIFKITDMEYLYAYTPEVTIFVREYSLEEIRSVNPNATSGFIDYKLVIDDKVFNAIREK